MISTVRPLHVACNQGMLEREIKEDVEQTHQVQPKPSQQYVKSSR